MQKLKPLLVSLGVVTLATTLAACEGWVEISTKNWKDLEKICEKNGGVRSINYETVPLNFERATHVYCHDGARFSVTNDIGDIVYQK